MFLQKVVVQLVELLVAGCFGRGFGGGLHGGMGSPFLLLRKATFAVIAVTDTTLVVAMKN